VEVSLKMQGVGLLLIFLLLLPASLIGQSISNIRLESSHDKVWVLYDLQCSTPQDISIVFVSDVKGKITPVRVSGAVGRVAAGSNHRIDWDALAEVGEFGGNLYAELSINKGLFIQVGGRKLEVAEQDFSEAMTWNAAERACQNLGNGWRLPDKDELKAVYQQLHKQGKGNFKDVWYWSSSQYVSGYAWYVSFGSGNVDNYFKSVSYQVRAVRALP